jgi:streptomycin 6-kinase
MLTPTLGGVPPTARRRLVDHYGPAVDSWLDAVPRLMSEAAFRWGLTLVNYHDAGCASSIAVARTPGGRSVLVKAWYEQNRYVHEIVALRTWKGRQVPDVVHQADDLAVAALEVVGDRPGGAMRPPGELRAVALALADLHAVDGPGNTFPRLDEYLDTVVLPRIGRRLHSVGGDIPPESIEALSLLDPYVRAAVLLHADIYRENVLFDVNGRPVFVDPLPLTGDPVFDWAFWVVYYELIQDPVPRLRLASAIAEIQEAELVPWCLCLCVDGLLFYREAGDPRAARMADVIAILSRRAYGARPHPPTFPPAAQTAGPPVSPPTPSAGLATFVREESTRFAREHSDLAKEEDRHA